MLNPTMTTLNVRWEPAEGRVKEYKLIYAPAAGGDESKVGPLGQPSTSLKLSVLRPVGGLASVKELSIQQYSLSFVYLCL